MSALYLCLCRSHALPSQEDTPPSGFQRLQSCASAVNSEVNVPHSSTWLSRKVESHCALGWLTWWHLSLFSHPLSLNHFITVFCVPLPHIFVTGLVLREPNQDAFNIWPSVGLLSVCRSEQEPWGNRFKVEASGLLPVLLITGSLSGLHSRCLCNSDIKGADVEWNQCFRGKIQKKSSMNSMNLRLNTCREENKDIQQLEVLSLSNPKRWLHSRYNGPHLLDQNLKSRGERVYEFEGSLKCRVRPCLKNSDFWFWFWVDWVNFGQKWFTWLFPKWHKEGW